jgi:hypothetical protein
MGRELGVPKGVSREGATGVGSPTVLSMRQRETLVQHSQSMGSGVGTLVLLSCFLVV